LVVQITGKGDTDENDDRIYTYYRNAEFTVKGKEPNKYYYLVYALGVIVVLYGVWLVFRKFKSKKATVNKN